MQFIGEPSHSEEGWMIRWMILGEHSWCELKHCCRCTFWPGSWSEVMGTSVQMKLKGRKDNRNEKKGKEKGEKERVNYPKSSKSRGKRNTNRPLCSKVAWHGAEINLFWDLCLWLEKMVCFYHKCIWIFSIKTVWVVETKQILEWLYLCAFFFLTSGLDYYTFLSSGRRLLKCIYPISSSILLPLS